MLAPYKSSPSLGLLLGAKASGMAPNGVEYCVLFLYFTKCAKAKVADM